MYTIRLVDPRRERILWAAITARQQACYARYGASKASAEYDPFSGLVFALAVLDGDGIPVAGARLHVRDHGYPLPIERHFAGNALLAGELEIRGREGVGEVSGLWASAGLAGTGVGGAIVAATTAHAPVLGVRHLIAFVHHHHRFNEAVGFLRDDRFGEVAYPDARYRSVVRWCDAKILHGADPAVRLAILLQRRRLTRGETIPFDHPVAPPAREAAIVA
jgi:hypothetical protein